MSNEKSLFEQVMYENKMNKKIESLGDYDWKRLTYFHPTDHMTTGEKFVYLEKLLTGSKSNDRILFEQVMSGEYYLEMARIGYIPLVVGSVKREYEVYVNTNDSGKIPHFHVRLKADWSKFHTCVCFMAEDGNPAYFHHGTKQDVLSAPLKKELVKLFRAQTRVNRADKAVYVTNWELACLDWNRNNSDVMIPEHLMILENMPDYRKL